MKSGYHNSFTNLLICLGGMLVSCQAAFNTPIDATLFPKVYCISLEGNDNSDGSREHPWKSISKINGVLLNAGDSVLLQAGQSFKGTLNISSYSRGSKEKLVIIGSYGNGIATINSGNEMGLVMANCVYIQLRNIKVQGAGRKEGNITSGVFINHSDNIEMDGVEISGFQKSGLLVSNSSEIIIKNVYAHDNGFAGISVDGENFSKNDCRHIEINNCRAENNPGDPTQKNNHSGNGIIVSQCTGLKIAYCTATNNGWDMPRIGNGPVGIWAWDADSVTIEHCLSYRNKTSKGGEDGGGFDFDGGITNSVIQYCLSYENDGSGIGLFEYDQAGPWYNNTIRYNISINDGNVSAAKAGIYIWNASVTNKLKDCFIYNNSIYNSKNAAISFAKESASEGFAFYDNIFVGNHEILLGDSIAGKYLGNCWWSLKDQFNVNKITLFEAWVNAKHQELMNGKVMGINENPAFGSMDNLNINQAEMLAAFGAAKTGNPLLLNKGIDLQQAFGILTGGKDFNGKVAPLEGIGANF